MDNIFKHTSRSYHDVYNAFVVAYPRKPTWIFQEMSGLFDFQSELMNRIASDILYPQTRESAYSFAASCDYTPVEADGATDTLTLNLTGAIAKTLAIGYQVGGFSLATGRLLYFETTAVGNSGGGASITVACKQKRTYSNIDLGVVNSAEVFSDYPVDGYANIIKSSFTLEVDGTAWTRVENFDNSLPTSKHFILLFQSSGKVRVQFGDGSTGLIPVLNSRLVASFATTEGTNGRLDAGEITLNIGADPDISAVTNTGTSGGNDAESVASIIRNARANNRLREIVWSKEDLEIAARMTSSSVQKALGVPGLGTASIYIVPSGGGNPGAPLLAEVETFVKAKTQFGNLPIVALVPNYIEIDISAEITVRSGYVEATVQNLCKFALQMVACEFDIQVLEYWDDHGIDECRQNIINVLFSHTFVEDDNDALEFILGRWRKLLGANPTYREYREWGQDLEVGDLWIMGDDLIDYGVDIFRLTSPVVNRTVADDEIVSVGTVTVTIGIST